jgi:hypothetical protein
METRTGATGLLVAALVLATPGPAARAGACPGQQLRVFPDGGSTVPTNVQVRLDLDASEVTVYELVDERTRQVRKSGQVQAGAIVVELRPESGPAVPVTVRRPPSTHRPLILVSPRRPLAARTRHQVVVRSRTEAFVVARFTTGNGAATTAPALGPITSARFGRHPRARHWKDATGAWAEVTLAGGSDAEAFEVHVLRAGDAPTDATLRAIVPRGVGRPVTVRLHDGGPCHGANFAFPPVPRGARSSPLRLGLRAVDAAGNASPVREVTLVVSP